MKQKYVHRYKCLLCVNFCPQNVFVWILYITKGDILKSLQNIENVLQTGEKKALKGTKDTLLSFPKLSILLRIIIRWSMDMSMKGGVHVSLFWATVTNQNITVQIDYKFESDLDYCDIFTKWLPQSEHFTFSSSLLKQIPYFS